MVLSDISVKRPIFATVVSLVIIVFGIISYTKLPVREYPDVDAPIVTIETTYTGAAASVVDTRITKIIEDQISGIEGVRNIDSKSTDGVSTITVEFTLGRNIDSAANDLRDRVNRVIDDLPDEADTPQITKVDADASPILWYSLTSNSLSRIQITDYAERFIVDRLGSVDGVARVNVSAPATPAMRIWIDRQALAARSLTIADVEAAIRAQNVELPGGRIESLNSFLTVRVERAYATADQFRGLVVRRDENGNLTRLGDVATVEVAPENDKSEFRGDGQDRIGLGIVRISGANALDVARGVKVEVDRIREGLPAQISLLPSYDTTQFIDASMHEVWLTFAIAGGCVLVVIFVFLGNFRATIIPMLAVPVSILGAFIAMYATGSTVNLITLLALVLAIGLVVDDAIVVLENIYRRMELGETPLVASYRGAQQVGFAVIATTLVLIAVFVPIVFLAGITGRIFAELSIAMAASVAFSGLVALTLTPMLCSKLLKPKAGAVKGDANSHRHNTERGWMQRRYAALLKPTMSSPSLVILAVAGVVGLTFLMVRLLPQEFTPPEDRGALLVTVKGPEGASFEYTRRYMREIEKDLQVYTQNGEASTLIVRTPGGFGVTEEFNTGRAIMVLSGWDKRERSGLDIVPELRQRLQKHPGVRVNAFMRGGLVQRGDQPVNFVIGASEYSVLAKARDVLLEKARNYPGLTSIDSDYAETKPQLLVDINGVRAAELGVSTEVIGRTLETLLGSREVTTYIDQGEEYNVILQAKVDNRLQPTDLTNIFVRSATSNTLIPLSNVVTLKERADAATLPRYNKVRSVTITASLTAGYSLGDALAFLERTVREELPEIATVDYKGESLEFKQTGQSLVFVLGLALVIIFLILAAQFESFIHPLIIILTVPLAVSGAALALLISGGSINIFSQVGILMLIGIAAKNGILIVEFANQLRDEGMSVDEAILEASQDRLRPILMTSIATAAGAVPLALAHGAGAETRAVIGLVVLAGTLSATLLTLFIIPAMYRLLAPYTKSPSAVARQLENEEKAADGGGMPAPAE
ncbi:MAG: efflux RND transporter permease subunit [Chitinophagales bacterium]|nr:efflux RND transporter permease subunit [Hyphomicrobiales bacterium]